MCFFVLLILKVKLYAQALPPIISTVRCAFWSTLHPTSQTETTKQVLSTLTEEQSSLAPPTSTNPTCPVLPSVLTCRSSTWTTGNKTQIRCKSNFHPRLAPEFKCPQQALDFSSVLTHLASNASSYGLNSQRIAAAPKELLAALPPTVVISAEFDMFITGSISKEVVIPLHWIFLIF